MKTYNDQEKSSLKANLRAYYDNHAAERDSGQKQDWKIAERRRFVELLKKESAESLLEIGAGPGQDAEYFVSQGFTVTAIDISEKHVGLCKAKGINAIQMDVHDLGKLDREFDAVFSLNALLHVPRQDIEKVFACIKGRLKPGGYFSLGVYGGKNLEDEFVQNEKNEKRFFSFFEFEDYRTILEKYFTIVSSALLHKGTDLEHHSFILRKQSNRAKP